MRGLRRSIGAAMVLVLLLAAALWAFAWLRARPENLPWTKLDLGQPIGMFTGRKLAGLTGDAAECRRLLTRAGVHYAALPAFGEGQCSYADGVLLGPGGSRSTEFAGRDPPVACPVAAALAMWEWEVLQPAARRHFNARVETIEHFGAYSCRRMYGRSTGGWSEHATADAIDIRGFRLSDGTRITLLRDWEGEGAKAAFLREVRDGACKLFATTLSPDYNAAHRDHFHLDQAARGEMGWRACR